MKYSTKQINDGQWLVVDQNDEPAIACPVSHAVAEKLAERWNETPEAQGLRPPAKIEWSDAGSTLLMAAMQKYGFVIPAKRQADWRAKDEKGTLPSLGINSVTLVATDGIVAYFLLGDDKTLFFGHLSAFVENKKESAALRAEGREKKPRVPKKSSVDAAMALLVDFIKNSSR